MTLLLLTAAVWLPSASLPAPQAVADPSAAYFARGPVHELRLVLDEAAEESLREDPREWARCEIWMNGARFAERAGVKLKGAAGSFREYDDRPALTVRLDKFEGEAELYGLTKFHLNNSVQDESFLSEWIGSHVFRAAGVPATRVAHAFVRINERDLGLYVLKEGFDDTFLARWYEAPCGNLDEGGFCQDIDAELERDAGSGPKGGRDLRALAEACSHVDLLQRWPAIEQALDVPKFVRFMALEMLLGHWDGYTGNSNNYRLYIARKGRAEFLPHGMDQLLGDPWASTLDMPWSLVAGSVMRRPEWRALYRAELRTQLPRLAPEALKAALAPVQARIQAALARRDPGAAAAQAARYRELLQRIEERATFLAGEVEAPEPPPLQLMPGVAVVVGGWHPHSEVEDATLSEDDRDGRAVFVIGTGPSARCIASFRRGLLLERGRYRFEVEVVLEGVTPLEEPDAPPGGLRLVSSCAEGEARTGTKSERVVLEFDVTEALRDVELGFELRARAGSAVLHADAIRLTREPLP